MLRKTVQYLKTLERAEAKKESEETQQVVELAEVEVNEEEVEWGTQGEAPFEEEQCDLDPEQVRQGRKEEKMNYMVKTLEMFEFGSWQEATLKAGKAWTMTKWIDRVTMGDDGREFVRCPLVARDFKPRREGPRDDFFAAMPPLGAKRVLFAYVAGVREKRREQRQEVKPMFINMKKAHLNAEGRMQEVSEVCEAEEMALWSEEGSVRVGGWLRKETGGGRGSTWHSSCNDIQSSNDSCACRCAWRRLDVRTRGVGAEE